MNGNRGAAYLYDVTIPTTVTSVVVTGSGGSQTLAGTLPVGTSSVQITFSQPVVGADQASNFSLQSVGPDGLLGTADDVSVPVSASYSGTTATLTFAGLTQSVFRLTVKDAITDVGGNPLDGTATGIPGSGNYTHDFVAISTPDVPLTSPNGFTFDPQIGGDGTGQLVSGTNNAFNGVNRLLVGGGSYSPSALSFPTATQTLPPAYATGGSVGAEQAIVPGMDTGNFVLDSTRVVNVSVVLQGAPTITSLSGGGITYGYAYVFVTSASGGALYGDYLPEQLTSGVESTFAINFPATLSAGTYDISVSFGINGSNKDTFLVYGATNASVLSVLRRYNCPTIDHAVNGRGNLRKRNRGAQQAIVQGMDTGNFVLDSTRVVNVSAVLQGVPTITSLSGGGITYGYAYVFVTSASNGALYGEYLPEQLTSGVESTFAINFPATLPAGTYDISVWFGINGSNTDTFLVHGATDAWY